MYALVLSCIYAGLRAELFEFKKAYYPRYNRANFFRNDGFLNLNETSFPSLKNYAVNANLAPETTYPWIARVIHSTSLDIPYVCTATCIDSAIFITAARCILTLKVQYTTVIYKSKQLHALAFVFPSEKSKQAYDDIGFIVVKSNVEETWSMIKIFTSVNRTDNLFQWFNSLGYSNGSIKAKVLGYTADKDSTRLPLDLIHFNLTELNVVVGLDLCSNILAEAFAVSVPCYHSCTFAEMLKKNRLCKNYHGVEGGAIIDTNSNKLLGVATWGKTDYKTALPVGFSFANSNSFYKDFTCARRIRNDNGLFVKKGYYQSLCDA